MRALFGMVFGAGVLLFVSKKEQTGKPVTGLFYRRMFWLVLFGLIHAHLILWIGDILYLYGFCGMIVYLFRNVKPAYLVLGVPLVAVVDFTAGTLFYREIRATRIAYVEASNAASEGKTLTAAQTQALSRWRDIEKTLIPNREDVKENTRKMKSDYATVAGYLRPLAFEFETMFMPIIIWDSLALMLLGLALYRWGFLSGNWANRDYWKVIAIGYGIGLPLVMLQLLRRLSLPIRTLEATPPPDGDGAHRMDPFDLSVPADPAGDGPRLGHHLAVQVTIRAADCSVASKRSGKWRSRITSCIR